MKLWPIITLKIIILIIWWETIDEESDQLQKKFEKWIIKKIPESSKPLWPITVKSNGSNKIIAKNNCPIDSFSFCSTTRRPISRTVRGLAFSENHFAVDWLGGGGNNSRSPRKLITN